MDLKTLNGMMEIMADRMDYEYFETEIDIAQDIFPFGSDAYKPPASYFAREKGHGSRDDASARTDAAVSLEQSRQAPTQVNPNTRAKVTPDSPLDRRSIKPLSRRARHYQEDFELRVDRYVPRSYRSDSYRPCDHYSPPRRHSPKFAAYQAPQDCALVRAMADLDVQDRRDRGRHRGHNNRKRQRDGKFRDAINLIVQKD